MPVYRISDPLVFPPPDHATPEGLLGVGGDLSPQRLLLAYRSGIFPWYSEGQPILWWSPDPRMVLYPSELHIPRSLKKRIRRQDTQITLDLAFERVISSCAKSPRPGQDGTWLTDDMQTAYLQLHQLGFAHSVEAWRDGELVGGLYGIGLGKVFCGESMFATAPDASKLAFVTLVEQLQRWGYPLVDCQVHTEHLARFGAREIPRARFLEDLHDAVRHPTTPGPWRFEASATDEDTPR